MNLSAFFTSAVYVPPTRISDGLYQGAYPDGAGNFDLIVFSAVEMQPTAQELEQFRGAETILLPLEDDYDNFPSTEDVMAVIDVAERVADALDAGKRVLVTCAMGKNRSGLITAMTLVIRYEISGKDALALVRAKRPGALVDPQFVELLERIKAPRLN